MRFRDFKTKLSNLATFNLNDIRKYDVSFHRQQLTDWQQRGFIQPVANGYYMLVDRQVDEAFLFMAANQIYTPSYISLESALAYYQVIPESVLGVTSVSARKTQTFDTAWGQFIYRSVKPAYMFGYQVVVNRPNQKFLMAKPEKAVLDYLYLNVHVQAIEDFEGLRWNKTLLLQLLDRSLFDQYFCVFNKRTLESRVNMLMRYLDA
jgi:hypothetical protein